MQMQNKRKRKRKNKWQHKSQIYAHSKKINTKYKHQFLLSSANTHKLGQKTCISVARLSHSDPTRNYPQRASKWSSIIWETWHGVHWVLDKTLDQIQFRTLTATAPIGSFFNRVTYFIYVSYYFLLNDDSCFSRKLLLKIKFKKGAFVLFYLIF